jgi:hypothetical protein
VGEKQQGRRYVFEDLSTPTGEFGEQRHALHRVVARVG